MRKKPTGEDLVQLIGWYHKSSHQEKLEYCRQKGIHPNTLAHWISYDETGVTPHTAPEQVIIEKIVEVPKPIDIEIKPPPVQEVGEREEEQIIQIGDLHAGLKTATFNSKVFDTRMNRLYDRVSIFADLHRRIAPVRKLNVHLLGDIVHGEMVGRQVSLDELELELHDQKWLAVRKLSELLTNWLQCFEEIEIVAVLGNHGITGRYNSFATNWNIEVYDLVKAYLLNYPQVKFTIVTDTFYAVTKIMGHTFLLVHGDKIPSSLGVPYYGIDRRALRWHQSLAPFDVLELGHFHSRNFLQPSGLEIYMNGTLSTDSRFALQVLGLQEICEFWTLFISKKYCVTAAHSIDLTQKGE